MQNANAKIQREFLRVSKTLGRLEKFAKLTLEGIMAGIEELQAKVNELQQAVQDDEAADAEVVARLDATIDDLRSQLAAAQPVDTQPLIDQLEAIKESLQPADGGSTGTSGSTGTGSTGGDNSEIQPG